MNWTSTAVRLRCLALLTGIATLLAVAATGSVAAKGRDSSGVVTFGEPAGSVPNYIFPMESGSFFTNQNFYQFSNQLYVPLYAFGEKGQPVLDRQLSLGLPPTFSDDNTEVTITLKHWVWSNGDPVTARDVVFWLNLLSAVTDPNAPAIGSSSAPGPGWGAAVPGGMPMNLVSYAATGTYTLALKLNASYNPTWFLHNELSQVYPIPTAVWDRLSASGPLGDYDAEAQPRVALPGTDPVQYVPRDLGTATTGALGVAQFLNQQSQTLATYDSNPLWKVVDGPFRLSRFTTSGYVKLVPNSSYSGSPKPTIAAFVEEPFTTDSAEFNVLRSGSLTIGYIPVQDLSQKRSLESRGYRFSPWYGYGINYLSYNYTNPKTGAVFRQLYFRQAVQSLVDQPEYVRDFDSGLGTPETGPVPVYPEHNAFESALEAGPPLYPFRPARAVSLLRSHGWHVVPGGTTRCARAGSGASDCGAGIEKGEALTFQMLYPTGSVEANNEMQSLQSTLRQKAGIDLNLRTAPYGQVTSIALDGCTPSTPCGNWDISNWVGYWTYAPDYLPTGEELFQAGADSNGGDYADSTAQRDIMATETALTPAAEQQALDRYQNYLARDLPVIFVPDTPLQLTMYRSDLRGLVPQNVFDIVEPQEYRLG